LLQRRRVESQHAPEAREDSAPAWRQVRIPRIGPPDVSAQRTAQAPWIGLVGEGVQLRLRRRIIGWRFKRFAILPSAHHRRRQPPPQVGITAGLPVELAPEAAHVLPQLAHHEIGAVATEVGPLWCVFGARQQTIWVALWSKQRTRRVEPVFVGIAEEELAETTKVPVFELIPVAHRALALPIDFGL